MMNSVTISAASKYKETALRILSYLILCLNLINFAHADISLRDIHQHKIPFSSLKGKWVFINYWASWCKPCVEEIEELNAFYMKNKDKMALFAVNYEGLSLAKQRKLIKEYGLLYPSLSRDPAKALALGDLRGVPATFVFNPEGKWVDTLYGGQTLGSLNAVMDEA